MIGRGFDPFAAPEPERGGVRPAEPTPAPEPSAVGDGPEAFPAWTPPPPPPEPEPEELVDATPPEAIDVVRDPDGPYRCIRDDKGRVVSGVIAPRVLWGRGLAHPHHAGDPRFQDPGPARRVRRDPFEAREIDEAMAERLRQRLDAPDPQALTRLELLARRVVDDALRGRQYAVVELLDRLQPPREKVRGAGDDGPRTIVQTIVVGPGGRAALPPPTDED